MGTASNAPDAVGRTYLGKSHSHSCDIPVLDSTTGKNAFPSFTSHYFMPPRAAGPILPPASSGPGNNVTSRVTPQPWRILQR